MVHSCKACTHVHAVPKLYSVQSTATEMYSCHAVSQARHYTAPFIETNCDVPIYCSSVTVLVHDSSFTGVYFSPCELCAKCAKYGKVRNFAGNLSQSVGAAQNGLRIWPPLVSFMRSINMQFILCSGVHGECYTVATSDIATCSRSLVDDGSLDHSVGSKLIVHAHDLSSSLLSMLEMTP